MAQGNIAAVDIFDWRYLVQIGVHLEQEEIENLDQAVQVFAYAFTSLDQTEDQNRLLAEWLQDATYLQSPETAEEIMLALAERTRGNLDLLRQFAKQNGVRLKRWRTVEGSL